MEGILKLAAIFCCLAKEIPIQETEYTCGPAALKLILQDYNIRCSEKVLAELAGTNKKTGTTFVGLQKALAKMEVPVSFSSSNIDKLRAHIRSGGMAIVGIQAWADKEQSKEEYAEDWENGHYVVPVKIDNSKISFADPYIGEVVEMPIKEFESRWHVKQLGKKEDYPTLFVW